VSGIAGQLRQNPNLGTCSTSASDGTNPIDDRRMQMSIRGILAFGVVIAVASCVGAGAPEASSAELQSNLEGGSTASGQAALACSPATRMPLEGRASAYDSAFVALGDAQAKVCYGRPEAKGRTIMGELVPFGELWRTGANEPTIIHLPVAASIAGLDLEPGSYSLYSLPGESEWTLIVNRSISQWGHESAYTDAVRAQEVGRVPVPVSRTPEHVETFTIRSASAGADSAELLLEWENTRVHVPIERRPG
jgi:hypothetical protein